MPVTMNQVEVVSTLLEHLDAMVAYWDRDQVCVFANDAYRHWFGKTREEVIGLTLRGLLGPDLYAKNLPYIRAAYEGQRQLFERDIPAPDGTLRHSLATYIPHIVDGEVQGIFVHVADVTTLKKLETQLRAAKERAEHLATHDVLTGLPNRALLVDRMAHAIAVSRREHKLLAVMSLDIDDFKKVNDTYGHAEGDRLLVAVAERLKNALRESDSVTRMGGDEFILLAPGMESVEEIEVLACRLLDKPTRPVWEGRGVIGLHFSIGIAVYPRDGATPEALLSSSDRALYAAKALGKNRYAFARSSEPTPGREERVSEDVVNG